MTISVLPRLRRTDCLLLLTLIAVGGNHVSGQDNAGPTEQPATAAQAATTQTLAAEIDERLQRLVAENAPGLALLAKRGDEVLYNQGFGLADLAHHAPVTPDTKFRIGSVTKNFTAAAILKLCDEGQLSVDDPLSKYLPDFPRGDEVTIAQLMNHTSGIYSYTSAPDFFSNVRLGTDEASWIKTFQDRPFDFAPGSKWSYNNSAYFLLGHLVSKISGKPYGQYLEETFFQPLGMEATGVHDPTTVLRHEAYGYSFTPSGFEKALDWDMSKAGGAGALYSTTGDLARWTSALFAGQVISDESLAAAVSPTILANGENTHYGFGWFIDTHRGLPRYSHGGGLQGFSSHLAYYPEQDFTVVVLHNALPTAPGMDTAALSQKIAETFLSNQMTDPADRPIDATVSVETMKKYVGQYDYKSAVMTVSLENDQLFAQITGQPRFEIYPASPTTFFLKAVEAEMQFQLDEGGNVTGVRHKQGPTEFIAEQLPERKEVELAADILDRHVGDYEMGVLGKMQIKRSGKQLQAKLASQPSLAIFPTSENEFFYKIVPATITFSDLKDGVSQTIILKQAGQTFTGSRSQE